MQTGVLRQWAAAVLWFCLAGSPVFAQSVPAGWVAHYRPGDELFVTTPPGWMVQAQPAGGAFAVFRAGNEGTLEALIFVKPQRLGPGRSLSDVLDRLPRDEAAMFPDAQIASRTGDPRGDYVLAGIRFAFQGTVYRGSALVVAHGRDHGALFVISESERTWPANAKTMAGILKHFTYMSPARAAPPAAPDGRVALPPMQLFRDPAEGAFTVPMPQGWSVQGGLSRPGLDVRTEVLAASPDGSIDVRIGDPRIPTFGAPYQIPFVGTTREGTVTAGGTIIWRYLPGATFLTQYYLPRKFGALQNVQAGALPDWAEHSLRVAPIAAPMRGRTDAGEVMFVWQTPQGPREFWYAALTRYVETPGLNGSGIWIVDALVGVSCVPGQMALAQAVIAQMHRGFTWNPQWLASEMRMRGEVAQAVVQHNAEMNAIVARTADVRARGGERAAAPRAAATRGEIAVQGSDGQRVVVPITGSQDYYRVRPSGEIVVTDRTDLPAFEFERMLRVP